MKEIEELYKQLADNEDAIKENNKLHGELKNKLEAAINNNRLLNDEREKLKSKIEKQLGTKKIIGLCFKRKDEDIMCQVLEFDKNDYFQITVAQVQKGEGILRGSLFTGDLAKDYTIVPLKEYKEFRDNVLKDLSAERPQKKK